MDRSRPPNGPVRLTGPKGSGCGVAVAAKHCGQLTSIISARQLKSICKRDCRSVGTRGATTLWTTSVLQVTLQAPQPTRSTESPSTSSTCERGLGFNHAFQEKSGVLRLCFRPAKAQRMKKRMPIVYAMASQNLSQRSVLEKRETFNADKATR